MLNISRCLSIANIAIIIFDAICEFSIKKARRREIQHFEYEANKPMFEEMNDTSIKRVE